MRPPRDAMATAYLLDRRHAHPKCIRCLIDGDVKVIKSYFDDHDLFIDESYVYKSKNFISRLPSNHCIQKIVKCEYKQSDKSPVTLVVETNSETKIKY